MALHLNILPEIQLSLFEKLSEQTFISEFYLAGGTCLALHIGHRQSMDFDFFRPSDFDTSRIIGMLGQMGHYERENEEMNTINGSIDGVRISFFGYRYRILEDFTVHNHIRFAGLKDISAMKLEAIAGRGSKKDFVDLYFLLKIFSLEEILKFHSEKYGLGLSNQYHHLKSLVYFADAENEAMPVMKEPISWEHIKKKITSEIKKYRIQ
jgi:hypothetical protein